MKNRTAAILALLFCLIVPAFGQSSPQPFTAAELDRFIADWPAFYQWAERRGEALDKLGDLQALGQVKVNAEMERFLGSRGWRSDRFFFVAGNSGLALLMVMMEEEMPEVYDELREQRKAIEQDPSMTRAQKDMILAQLDQAALAMQGTAGERQVTPAELELVRARSGRLKTAFGIE